MDKTNWKLRENLWRPTAYVNNRIRIAPALKGTEATWWMRVDIHVIKIYGAKKSVCNSQRFKKPCKFCEAKQEFIFERKYEEAKQIGRWKYTLLNIIDRAKEDEGVKVWMVPISAWWQIEKAIFHRSDTPLIIDSDGAYGCDLLVHYNPDEQYKQRYKISILQNDPRPLGTEEQSDKWAGEILPLRPENYFDPVEDEDVMPLKSVIKKKVFEDWQKKTEEDLREKMFRPLDKDRIVIGCEISDELKGEGRRLLEALDRKENIKGRLSKWLDEWRLEKEKLEQRDACLNRILEADGFKDDEHRKEEYRSAREKLAEKGEEGYRKWLEEHGGLEDYQMLEKIKSRLIAKYTEEEKLWLVSKGYDYVQRYNVYEVGERAAEELTKKKEKLDEATKKNLERFYSEKESYDKKVKAEADRCQKIADDLSDALGTNHKKRRIRNEEG